jgi:AraC-like DNA-binding protein
MKSANCIQNEPLQFATTDEADGKEWWRYSTARAYGLTCKFTPGESDSCRARSWTLGQLYLLRVQIAHQSLSPISGGTDEHLFLKFVTSGSMFVEQGRHSQWVSAGKMVLIDSGKPYRQDFFERTEMIALRIPKSLLNERGFKLDLRGLVSPDVTTPDVQAVGHLIRSLADQNGQTSTHLRSRQGEQMIDLIDVLMDDPVALTRPRSGSVTLHHAKQFIERNFRNVDLSATRIASEVRASEAHLNRLFRKEGMSLMQYVWFYRLDCALRLLKQRGTSGMQIQEVAYRCGFTTHGHFCRAFKQRYGLTPRDAAAGHLVVD